MPDGLPTSAVWPTIAAPWPSALLVQLVQVASSGPGIAVPSCWLPVRISCWFGVSPRPLIGLPFSSSAVSLLTLFLSLCRSATLAAISTPLAFDHGPLPIRSLALTPPWPCVQRYACH